MFVSGRLAITAGGITDEKDLTPETNVIFIRPKMDYGTRNKVVGAAAKLKEQARQQSRAQRRAQRGRGKSDQNDVEFDVGAYQTALLIHNVLGWHGPAFVGVACTPENIAMLDPDEPLVQTVADEITSRNAPKDDEPPTELDDPNVIDVKATAS
jgi:hypothetical protein